MKKLLGLTLLACSCSSFAQTSEFVQTIPEFYLPKDVNFSMGGIVLFTPKYAGSDEREAKVYPWLDAQWKNGAFFSTINGLGYNFSKNPNIQYGLRLGVEPARDESSSSKLQGLGDVDTTIEPGAFLNYNINQNYSLLSSIRYGSGVNHNGLQTSLGARFTTAINDQHRLTATIRANWVNASYMQSYFGVNEQQSINSGYAQYTPNSGMTDIKLSTSWHWTIDANWSLTTGASVSRYSSEVTKSPFVFEKTPVTVFSAASYRF